jgi:hypothetical protein
MIARAAAAGLLLASSACATVPPADESVPVHGATGYRCDDTKGQHLVGRPADAALGAEAQRVTGAGAVRWIRPGDMVTMDYREDRLNIELDERNRVKRPRCG